MSRLTSFSTVLGVAGLCALAVGCPSREVAKIDPGQQKQERKDIPVTVNRDIDILFVIDNSQSMNEEQTSITNNFQRFINVLENIEGGLPNVHIGIVSSNAGVGGYNVPGCLSAGDDGRLQNAPRGSCSPPSGYFISDIDGGGGMRTQNYTGTLAQTFSCIAKIGINGCGLEQHLESMKRALDGHNTQNAGFLRENAFLAIIFIADEDDCSAKDSTVFDPSQTSVSDPLGPLTSFRCTEFGIKCNGSNLSRMPAQYDPPGGGVECQPRTDSYMEDPVAYASFIKSLKGDPGLIITAGIIGNLDPTAVGLDGDGQPELLPSCQTSAGKAVPGVRIKSFLDQFPNRNTFTSICNEDLSDALEDIAELLKRIIGTPCLEGSIPQVAGGGYDIDANAPGIQIDCAVAYVQNPDTDFEIQTALARCPMQDDATLSPSAVAPCWYTIVDTMCMFPTQLGLLVHGADTAPANTHVIASCVTQ